MKLRDVAEKMIAAALRAVDPALAVHNAVSREGDLLRIGLAPQTRREYDLRRYERVLVVGGGKAGTPMALALSELLGNRLTAGWINVKRGYRTDAPLPPVLTIHEAGHPIPDRAGLYGARQVLRLTREAGERDLLFCLISGGGSALLPLPAGEITLSDLQAVTDVLLRCGATINEVNAVRKHCSQIKGGQLARAAYPATVISLILSDVVGNPLDVIASGPTVPDTTTFADAWNVLVKYGVLEDVPERVRAHLQAGIEGHIAETPKPGDPAFARVQNLIIGSNVIAATAAREAALQKGFNALLLSTYVEGEAREVGRVMAGIAKSLIAEGWPIPRPACVIAGGETTVTLRGNGKGGRNQELALAAAIALDGWPGVMLVTLATDGTDGPTDAAGAVVTGETVARARALDLDPTDFLTRNDSYTFFDRLGDLLRTGPTNTNVNDLLFILVESSRYVTVESAPVGSAGQ